MHQTHFCKKGVFLSNELSIQKSEYHNLSTSTPTTAQIFAAHQIRIYPIRRYRIYKQKRKLAVVLSNQQDLDDFIDEHFHATGIGAILIFEGQICNCFTVPLSIDNSAYLSQLSKIVGEVNLQIFLNKINVWFDTVTPEKSSH